MDLQDRAIIVTGGASGIGRATALLLAREGAKILIGDVDAEGRQRPRAPPMASPSTTCRWI
jgi:NAD(P)-dependent dehydrogenase (short-subunit alcohol dehydrogenase family)